MLIYNPEMINVYDANGNKVNEIEVGEPTQLLHYDRVSKGDKFWYKGAGIIYDSHYLPRPQMTSEYEFVSEGETWYVGNVVKKKCFVGKQGIFMERHQAQFNDFIGSCGVRELSIIENSEFFRAFSDIEVIKANLWDKENKQYWFKLRYLSNRIKYTDKPNPEWLWDLIAYMIQNDWNFNWDKNSISDISYNGTVTDVADIFKSRELNHKLGTVYSILYSLNHFSPRLMLELLINYGLYHVDSRDFINNSIKVLANNGIDVSSIQGASYEDIILDHLIMGRNCGDCTDVGLGDSIRKTYLNQTTKLFKRN